MQLPHLPRPYLRAGTFSNIPVTVTYLLPSSKLPLGATPRRCPASRCRKYAWCDADAEAFAGALTRTPVTSLLLGGRGADLALRPSGLCERPMSVVFEGLEELVFRGKSCGISRALRARSSSGSAFWSGSLPPSSKS